MVLCIPNSAFSIRINNLYVSQPSFVPFAGKTAPFGSELQVSIGPRHHLSFCACKTFWLAPQLLDSKGPRPHLSFCACKTIWLAWEILVSMSPNPHLWFFHAKQRLLDQNDMSLWVPDFIFRFCMQNSDFWIRITSLYGSQTSPMFFCIQNSDFSTRIVSLYGSQPLSAFFAYKTGTLD